MVSEDVYSIVQRKAFGYQGYAWNLYFQKRQQNITIDGVNISVENVTTEEIRLRVGKLRGSTATHEIEPRDVTVLLC